MNKTWLLAVAGLLGAVPASAAIVVNGDFEAGNTGFTSGYTYVGTPGPYAMYPEGTYTVGADAAAYHNLWASVAAYSGTSYLIANGAPGASVPVWQQTVSGLVTGRAYTFTAYVTNVCCNAAFGGGNSTPVITATDGGAFTASVSAPITGAWTKLSGSFVAAAPTATLTIANDNSIASGNDFGVDAISVAAVPEPASWAMMLAGAGMLGGALRRRAARIAYAV